VKVLSKWEISTLQILPGSPDLWSDWARPLRSSIAVFKGTISRNQWNFIRWAGRRSIDRHRMLIISAPQRWMLELFINGKRRVVKKHLFNPEPSIYSKVQLDWMILACTKKFAAKINWSKPRCIWPFRGFFESKNGIAVPIEEVEPAADIIHAPLCNRSHVFSDRFFRTKLISTLAISNENRIGAKSNSGEGGGRWNAICPKRKWWLGTVKPINKVGFSRFGVTSNYLTECCWASD